MILSSIRHRQTVKQADKANGGDNGDNGDNVKKAANKTSEHTHRGRQTEKQADKTPKTQSNTKLDSESIRQ